MLSRLHQLRMMDRFAIAMNSLTVLGRQLQRLQSQETDLAQLERQRRVLGVAVPP